MAKKKFEMFISARQYEHESKATIVVSSEDYSMIDEYTLIAKKTISIEVPEFDLRPAQIEKLKAKREKILAISERDLQRIDEKINTLLALPNQLEK